MISSLSQEQLQYLQQFINSVAGFRLPLSEFDGKNQLEIFNFITRQEEADTTHRDQWGNWEGSFSSAYADGKLAFPWIDEIINDIANKYLLQHPDVTRITKYPENKPFAVCLTHDVDDINQYPDIRHILPALKRFIQCKSLKPDAIRLILLKALKELLCNSNKCLQAQDFYKLIEMEARHGFKSTFYCFSDTLLQPHYFDSLYRYTDSVLYQGRKVEFKSLVKQIQQAGWDIGLHGSYNSAFKLDLLKHEKESLQQVTGTEVSSSRQHWMHYDIARTPQIHQALKFGSDSTLGFNRFIGFRAGTSHPFKQWDVVNNIALNTLQIPQIIMDGALFYANSMELNEELAIKHCFKIMDRVEQAGGVLTISWHPNHINKPKFINTYRAILKEAARRNAWGCSARELTDHWNNYLKQVNQV